VRLLRPRIPIAIRRQVAARQGLELNHRGTVNGYQLHHDPALCNRDIVEVDAKEALRAIAEGERHPTWFYFDRMLRYEPDANDPNHLVYMPIDDHDIRTRVRGAHGQHSDLALRRKRKRAERKAKRPKRKWPKRKMRWWSSRFSSSSPSR
jgi:hypothetical protein